MAVEEGEICEAANDPSHEWPAQDDSFEPFVPQHQRFAPAKTESPPLCRLVVEQSTVLPGKQRLAIVDGYTELQFGRDVASVGTDTPRVRLKEMEVSRLHATVFWDVERHEWAVVDMGSKHGTFVKSGDGEGSGAVKDERGVRLSAPRIASMPKRLRHMDHLSMGGTTFVVHVHEERLPCVECSASAYEAGDEIPLFPAHNKEAEGGSAQKRKREEESAGSATPPVAGVRDAKKALSSLKRDLLSKPDYSPAAAPELKFASTSSYTDRSARRRALHPSSAPDTPGVVTPVPAPASSWPRDAAPTRFAPSAPPSPPRSAPAVPLAPSNVGHRLLMMQGWQPGTALGLPGEVGDGGIRLVEPLAVNATEGRAGLGMAGPLQVNPSPADRTQRRWRDLTRMQDWAGA
ncbi:hypothetical protein BV25DRAFT_1822501 [Artomyces pyxidatus]|uniref:Uncharacterized protein n=1 Tax=Artomyces pyxidatus TaxID=48021 RepID=A0ACB8T9A9_9AGAM|nr:hypothetical protein BV25DRAFT_1822501 [Artomyces pyxidatus]